MKEQRQHQWRVRRNYQFPNAAKVIREDNRPTTTVGWVVNVVLNLKQVYGVVRYVVGGDRTAWLESEHHFGEDVAAAEDWVRETIAQVQSVQFMSAMDGDMHALVVLANQSGSHNESSDTVEYLKGFIARRQAYLQRRKSNHYRTPYDDQTERDILASRSGHKVD